MQALVKYQPSFAAVFAHLDGQDALTAEAGAMVSRTPDVEMSTSFRGGLVNALLLRFFGGESLFVNRFTAKGRRAEVVLAAATPGDVARVDLNGTSLFLETGALLAYGDGVDIGVRWAGVRHFIAREGLFKLQASGSGPVFIGGYGSIEPLDVNGSIIVDTGHVLAFEPTLQQTLRLSGGILSSLFGGEGLVSKFEGRGRLWLQTRNVSGLAAWANSLLR